MSPAAAKAKPAPWRRWMSLGAAGVALALLALVQGFGARKLGSQIALALTRQNIEIERATSIRRDARKTYVAVLERCLLPSAERGQRADQIVQAVIEVERATTKFMRLQPLAPTERARRAGLAESMQRFSGAVRRTVAPAAKRGETGAEIVAELRPYLDSVDSYIEDLLKNDIGNLVFHRQIALLQRQQRWLQLGAVASAIAALFLFVMWRSRLRAQTRFLAMDQARVQQESAAKLHAQFFANMSHELRTPLVAVQGFAARLQSMPGASEPASELAARIQREAQDLLARINNILDVAKLGSGHVQLMIEDVDIHQVVQRCVRRCEGLIGGKPITLLVELPPDLPPARADFVKLQQVFTNLLANAIKFTERGRVVLRGARHGRSIVFEVEDTGVGMDPRILDTIWSPFVQADGSIARKYGGTGLGLAIVRNLVQLLGATIAVRSTPNAGSTFTVTIPCATTPDATQLSAARAAGG